MKTLENQNKLLLTPTGFTIDWETSNLGTGYKAMDFTPTRNRPVRDESIEATRSEPGKTDLVNKLFFKAEIAKSKEELFKKLNIGASASASNWGVKAEGKVGFLSSTELSSTSLVIAISAKKVLSYTYMDEDKLFLKEDAENLIKSPKPDFKQFYDRYGSHFIGRVANGGELTVFFIKEFSTLEEKNKIFGEFHAKAPKGEVSGNAMVELLTSIKKEKIQAKVFKQGGSDPQGINFDDPNWINWVLKTWIPSIDEKPAVIEAELWDLWTIRNSNTQYDRFLNDHYLITDELTHYLVEYQKVQRQFNYLYNDAERLSPSKSRRSGIKVLLEESKKGEDVLINHFKTHDPFRRENPENVLEGIPSPKEFLEKYEELYQVLTLEKPLEPKNTFYIQSTGTEGDYFWGLGKDDWLIPVKSMNHAVAFKFEGSLTHDQVVKIYVANGKKYMTIGTNAYIKVQKNPNKWSNWLIKLRDWKTGDDTHVRHQSRIMIMSNESKYRDQAIKKGKRSEWLQMRNSTRHFLRIIKAG